MKRSHGWILAFLVLGTIAFLAITENNEGPGYWELWTHYTIVQAGSHDQYLRKISSFDLPGPGGKRFDYLTIIPDRHLLLSAHLGAGRLYVIDLINNRVINTIEDLPGIEAVEVARDVDKAYTSNWGEHMAGVIDLKQMKVIKKLPVENKPDGIAYAPPFHKMYISDERAKAEVVIDVVRDEIVKTIKFESETGMPQFDPVGRHVWVNLQDQNLIAEIDPATDNVIGKYPVGDCRGNHGMALDPGHRRAFLSCEDNDLMTVIDLDNHKVITSLPMAGGADVIKFDAGLQRIYVACGGGALSIFYQDDPDHYRKLQDFPVEKKVHSIAVDQATHRVYTPEEQESGKPVARMIVYEPITSSRPTK
jgi:DNA-binding beta-propeller fold protein YncE